MLVTPHISPENRNFSDVPDDRVLFPRPGSNVVWYPRQATKTQLVGFVDWLSIHQRHGGDLPILHNGSFLRLDAEGRQVNTRLLKLRVEGSYDTSIYVRCDGETVWFEGNVSRYGRPDNVFGYSFRSCLIKINMILGSLGLPAFTEGNRFITNWKGQPRSEWTGAVVTRVDLTQNFCTGSPDEAYAFLRWLQGQQASRVKTGTHGDGETVDFGRGSRRIYSKAYLKSSEIRRHASKGDFYLQQLADWCHSIGLIRFETTYKGMQLADMGCRFLGGFDMKQLEIDFETRKEVLTRGSAELDDLSLLPKAILATYRMWQAGDDIASKLKRTQFYVHRKALLPYGVDIAIKSSVIPFPQKTRVIKLGPVSMPEWYELPEIERKRHGNGC